MSKQHPLVPSVSPSQRNGGLLGWTSPQVTLGKFIKRRAKGCDGIIAQLAMAQRGIHIQGERCNAWAASSRID